MLKKLLLLSAVFILMVVTPAVSSDVTISLFLVDQNVACKPDGYPRPCDPWGDLDDAEKLRDHTNEMMTVTLEAGETLYYSNSFSSVMRINARNRNIAGKAVMLLFDWGIGQTGGVTLTREISGILSEPIPMGDLQEERRWLNHQGAPHFSLDGPSTLWTLSLNGEHWYIVNQQAR